MSTGALFLLALLLLVRQPGPVSRSSWACPARAEEAGLTRSKLRKVAESRVRMGLHKKLPRGHLDQEGVGEVRGEVHAGGSAFLPSAQEANGAEDASCSAGEGLGVHAEEMRGLRPKICIVIGCLKAPSYGNVTDNIRRWCAAHREPV